MLFLKSKLEKSWYAEKVGAGLHIVAAVTESCVTGHAMNWFRGSNCACGWSEVWNKEDKVFSHITLFHITVWRKPGGSDDRKKKQKAQAPPNWRTSNLNEPVPWDVVARVRHGSQGASLYYWWSQLSTFRCVSTTIFSWCQFWISFLGEPFLHVERDALSIPGDSKHVCRFKIFPIRFFEAVCFFYRVLVYKEESKTLVSILIDPVDLSPRSPKPD